MSQIFPFLGPLKYSLHPVPCGYLWSLGNMCVKCLWSECLLYVTTSLLSTLILSSNCGKACFSANSIYLGSGNRSSKFKCWCLSLIQAKWSLWEERKIGKPLLNRRWLIGADSLRAVTVTTSETSTLLRICKEALIFAIIKGSEMITKYNHFLIIIFAWCGLKQSGVISKSSFCPYWVIITL